MTSSLKQSKTVRLNECQNILFNNDGYILTSDDVLFSASDILREPLTKYFPLIESILDMLLDMKEGDPELHFARVVTIFNNLPGYYDFTFTRTNVNGESAIMWRIFDLTDLYADLKCRQQEHHNKIVFPDTQKEE